MPPPRVNPRGRRLLEELESFLANPRANEIIANDWLHDGDLPMPSLDLIRYLAVRLLGVHGMRIATETGERYALIDCLIGALREETSEARRASIPQYLNRLDCFRYLHSPVKGDPFIHEWLPILSAFLYPGGDGRDPDSIALAAGERILARGFLETMTHRAIFTQDHRRVRSLAEAMKIMARGSAVVPTVANRVKGEVLRAFPYLREMLGRNPSRAEIVHFVRQLAEFKGDPPFPVRGNPWSDAFKVLSYPADPRKVRIDSLKITQLARGVAKNTG